MLQRRTLIRLFTFLGGIYFFLQFVLPATIFGVRLDAYDSQISDGFVAIGAMAVGLGLVNLLRVHGGRIVFRRTGWVHSLGLLAGLVIMIVVTTQDWAASRALTRDAEAITQLRDFALRIKSDAEKGTIGVLPLAERAGFLVRAFDERASNLAADKLAAPAGDAAAEVLWRSTIADYTASLTAAQAAAAALAEAPSAERLDAAAQKLARLGALRREVLMQQYRASGVRGAYALLYDGLFVALGSAMFSLLGFYIAAAAYRAFRVRSAESALMMAAALVVMLGQIPFGLWIWEGFPEVRLWLLSVPSTAAFRAIKIGAAVAGLILAFRVWFSIESESFSREGS